MDKDRKGKKPTEEAMARMVIWCINEVEGTQPEMIIIIGGASAVKEKPIRFVGDAVGREQDELRTNERRKRRGIVD
jgi:hypothetical protein